MFLSWTFIGALFVSDDLIGAAVGTRKTPSPRLPLTVTVVGSVTVLLGMGAVFGTAS